MQAALNLNHPDERVIAPYDIKLVNADDEEEVVQPKDSDSVLVKIILPKEYKGKVVNAYHLGDSLKEADNLQVQRVGNECFVYFDAKHFSDYFLTGRDDANVSIKTSQSGDLTLGRVTPTGFTLKAKGSSHTLTFTSNDLSKGNKVTIDVYSYDDVSKSFILDSSKSNIVNMYKQSAFTISNIQNDTYVDVSFSFDESFKEEPKPTPPSGGGGGGGGASITIGTLPIDDKGQVIMMHKAYMNGYDDHTFKPQNYISREEVAAIVARCHEQFVEEYNYAVFNDFQDAASRWSKNYIGFLKYKELIHGYEDGSYHPTSNMTRAELAVLVNNFLRVQNFEVDEEKLESPAFSDVDGRWYEKDVNKLAAMGILNGYEDGTFKGDQFVTRIEVAIVMNKINGRTVKKDIPDEYIEKVTSAFRDVASNRWFFKDVAEATVSHPADLY
ncbi:MAG: S-layer homology domain-containing protein [Clostridia bacterium]|nr:S-layer homology domain-containing protein [Clostridia bacterium]